MKFEFEFSRFDFEDFYLFFSHFFLKNDLSNNV